MTLDVNWFQALVQASGYILAGSLIIGLLLLFWFITRNPKPKG